VDELGLVWKRRIGDRHRDIAIRKECEESERDKDDAEDESKQESHKCCSLRRFSSYCMKAEMKAKSSVARPKDVSPVHGRFEMFK
jgi:hypothetical protein